MIAKRHLFLPECQELIIRKVPKQAPRSVKYWRKSVTSLGRARTDHSPVLSMPVGRTDECVKQQHLYEFSDHSLRIISAKLLYVLNDEVNAVKLLFFSASRQLIELAVRDLVNFLNEENAMNQTLFGGQERATYERWNAINTDEPTVSHIETESHAELVDKQFGQSLP